MSEKQARRSPAPETPAFRDVLEQVGNTKEVRQLASALLPELIRLWAISGTGAGLAKNTFRKRLARVAGSSIKSALLDEKGLAQAPSLPSLAGDPEFARQASAQAGEMLNKLLTLLVNATAEIDGLDTAAKKELIQTIARDMSSGKSAQLITFCCRAINDIHKNEPEFLARVLTPEFEQWIKNLDFGELKELLDSASPGISALARMINVTMWNYPAKVISTLALVPSIVNIAIDSLAQVAGTFNEKGSPDLIADVILSVLREIDAPAIGRLFNEAAEMTRRLHVGSALIGEPGSPQMPKDVMVLLEAIIKAANGEVLWKARTALAELKEQAGCALTDVIAAHPDILAGGIAAKASVHNARIRSLSHRLSVLKRLGPEEINSALGQALANLDIQEGVNIINAAVMLANRLLEERPEEIKDKAAALIDALDTYEVSVFMEKTGEIIGSALRPLARAIVPQLSRGFFSSLAAADDEFEDTAETARQLLTSLLKDGEGNR